MSKLDIDEPHGSDPPDYKLASLALWISQGADFARRVGLDYETFTRVSMVAHEVYRAVSVRGARVGEIVEAIRKVRPHGSILADLPGLQAKVRAENPE